MGSEFSLKVGAKCSAGCSLTGEEVEIVAADGVVVAKVRLGDAPWRGTDALYWTEARVPAPADLGHYRWSVRMNGPHRAIPHRKPQPASFSFLTVGRAEHNVVVELVDEARGTPIEKAYGRLGPFRRAGDENGLLTFSVPGGEYTLSVMKDDHEIPSSRVRVDRDLRLKVLAKVLPKEDPYAFYWKGKTARRSKS
jgi:hypothetical protein